MEFYGRVLVLQKISLTFCTFSRSAQCIKTKKDRMPLLHDQNKGGIKDAVWALLLQTETAINIKRNKRTGDVVWVIS